MWSTSCSRVSFSVRSSRECSLGPFCLYPAAAYSSDRRRKYPQRLVCRFCLAAKRISVKRPHWAQVRLHLLRHASAVGPLPPVFLRRCERLVTMRPQKRDTGIAEELKLVQVVYFQGLEGNGTRLIEPVFEGLCGRLAVSSTRDRTDL